MRANSQAVALRVLSMAMGIFLLFMGLDKIDWFVNGGLLTQQLQQWRGMGRPLARWYIDTIALPGAPVLARVVPLAELVAGTALLLGVRVRLAAALAVLMVINFHVAADVIFRYEYLWNGYGPPVLGALLALSIGGVRLPFSLSK
ncbi:MAG: DoxX family membrane protein [Acidobacteria bacterium]|nr:DoxX family membrane protein [Acidobacteriota bacterium]